MHDGGIRVRFKHEIRNGQRVAHENVCRIHDLVVSHGDNGAPLAFTMELLEGETLREFLERKGKLSIEQALPLVRQMADGLSALHGRNVVHRDFKPGNIFVIEHTDGRIEVKITDFGLARQTFGGEEGGSRDSRSLGPIGTLRYMAPEQIDPDRGEIGPSTDVFAFGIVLYEMLTGANPFPAASLAGNLKEKTEGKPPPPQTLTAGIDKKWNQTILACLAPEPKDRPQSAGEVLEMLEGRVAPPIPWPQWARIATAAIFFWPLLGLVIAC